MAQEIIFLAEAGLGLLCVYQEILEIVERLISLLETCGYLFSGVGADTYFDQLVRALGICLVLLIAQEQTMETLVSVLCLFR